MNIQQITEVMTILTEKGFNYSLDFNARKAVFYLTIVCKTPEQFALAYDIASDFDYEEVYANEEEFTLIKGDSFVKFEKWWLA